jgi:hypothetical protein
VGQQEYVVERALLMRGIPVGGTLALVDGTLRWTRSKAGALGIILDKGPPELHAWLGDIVARKDGRKLPWTEIILCSLAWGLLFPLFLARPSLWLGPFNLVLMGFTGGYRHTLEIRTDQGFFYFSVRDVDSWLAAIIKAARVHGAGTPVSSALQEEPRGSRLTFQVGSRITGAKVGS